MIKTIFAFFLSLITSTCCLANSASTPVDYIHNDRLFPPIYFAASDYNDDLLKVLKGESAFESIDNNMGTLPIGIVTLVTKKRNADASSFATLMLSAGTLGLTPIVGGDQVSVHYHFRVQGETVAEYDYTLEGTDSTSLYSAQQSTLDDEDKQFVLASMQNFLNDLRQDERAQEIFKEYYLYFDEEL